MKPWSQGWLIAAGAYSGFCSMRRLEVFLLPLDGMLVHHRSLPRNFARFPQQFAGTHLYTWVERGTVRVKCLAQKHNTMSPARARTRTARSGIERTNHEATAPPTTHSIAVTKMRGKFPRNIVSSEMSSKSQEKPGNSLKFIWITFAQYCSRLPLLQQIAFTNAEMVKVYYGYKMTLKSN